LLLEMMEMAVRSLEKKKKKTMMMRRRRTDPEVS